MAGVLRAIADQPEKRRELRYRDLRSCLWAVLSYADIS